MARFSLSCFLAAYAAILLPGVHSIGHLGTEAHSFINLRSDNIYSTLNPMQDLTSLGASIYISPLDSFDFIPAPGYSIAYHSDSGHDAKKKFKSAFEFFDTWLKSEFNSEHANVVIGDTDKLSIWAADKHLHVSHQVPKPNESLPGKVLTIEGAKMLIRGAGGACHWIENGVAVCHQPDDPVNVIEVTVTTPESNEGKSSTLWVACHEENLESCHVLNVNDFVFTAE